ncbi:MAG: tripartite tricarboxylate transporter substrate binding protein [Burkholderiales bacterium]|nr:tripartite tricarboxylate transporter substrate binding protein [Burkholderiales bacterium]
MAGEPVRIIVGFPPGGGVDVAARLLGQRLSGIWGQPVVVENRPGAASVLGTRLAARATPDGHSVLINSSTMVVNQIVNPGAGYDIERDLVPVINAAWQPTIIVARPGLPVATLADLIALSRARKASFGTPGQGSMPHLGAAYLFGMLAKTDLLHVPYAGAAPALIAAASGQTDLAVVTMPPAVPLVKAGRVKAIAVTSARRTGALPAVPTVAEAGFPGYEVNVFSGFFMPAATPRPVVQRFRETVLKVLALPDVQEQLAVQGFEPADPAREDFARLVSAEIAKWTKVVKATGFRLE